MTTVPFHALFGEDNINPNDHLDRDPSAVIAAADVVFAQDVMTGHRALVYGRKLLERIAADKTTETRTVLVVAVDMDTDELERLIALVLVVKGCHDYQPAT